MSKISLVAKKVLGDDKFLVETSRMCTAINKDLTEQIVEKNIERLIRDKHWSVFEHALISYEIKAPIFVARQWMRHQQAYMEVSLRYTSDVDLYEGGAYSKGFYPVKGEQYWYDPIKEYKELIKHNVPKEDARRVLPLETMTTVQCTASVRTLLHMIGLRLDIHAQEDTRHLAGLLLEALDELFPKTVKAYLKWEYQSFQIDYETIEEILQLLEAYGNEGYSNGVERFVENGKRRIQIVRGITHFLCERRNDTNGNSECNESIEVNNTAEVEETGDKSSEGETSNESRQLQFEFDEMDT